MAGRGTKLGLGRAMSLRDFQDLWDFLSSGISIAIPNHLQDKAFLWENSKEDWSEYACQPDLETKAHPRLTRSYNFLSLGVLADHRRWSKLHNLMGNDTSELGYVSSDNESFIQVDEFHSIDFDGQAWFRTRFPHWYHGSFKDSFPELDEVSADFRQEDLGTVQHIVRGLVNATSESFEAFGIKMPADTVIRFGILLILAVQLYFAIHLSELSTRLRADDPGWEVAWIGVYQHKLAKSVYFVSVLLLPVGAVVALGVRGLIDFSFDRSSWATMILGIKACAVALGILIHLKKPASWGQDHPRR